MEEISILFADDNPSDVELMQFELRRAGIPFRSRHVATAGEFRAALEAERPDLVLSDYQLQQCTGLELHALLQEQRPDVPFVLVTGTGSEEIAVESMQRGVDDYVLKRHLARLPAAVRSCLDKRETQRLRQAAERRLEEALRDWEETFSAMADSVTIIGAQCDILRINRAGCDMLGITAGEIVGKKCYAVFHGTDAPVAWCPFERARKSKRVERFETCEPRTGRFLSITIAPIPAADGSISRIVHVVRDITEQQQAVQALSRRYAELERWKSVTLNREDRMRELKQEVNELCRQQGIPPRYGPDAEDVKGET